MRVLRPVSAFMLILTFALGDASAQSRPRGRIVRGELGAKLDLLLTRYAMYGFSGSVLVTKGGRVRIEKGYGLADRERAVPNTADTIFDVGSITKTFTAAAILQLETKGRLKTSDPVAKYLGQFPEDKAGVTLHHLLTHTAGFKLDAADAGVTPSDTPEVFLRKAKAAPLLSPPGEKYSYSNLGYALLAMVVEKVSGQSWQAYVKEHLLKPAGLSRTILYGDKFKDNARLARGYIGPTDEDSKLEEPLTQTLPGSYVWGKKYVLGAVGVLTTVGDMYKWWTALRTGRILTDSARQKMFTRQAGDQGYGWNIRESQNRVTRIHRGGLRGSFQSLLAYYPEDDTLLIYELNNNVGEGSPFWATTVWANMERVITGKDYATPPAVTSLPASVLRRYAGEYELPSGGKFVVSENKGSLFVGAEGQDAVNLLAYAHQPPPKFQDELNKLGSDVIGWLNNGEMDLVSKAGALSEKESAELVAKWKVWTDSIGGLQTSKVLGSAPGARGFVRTFFRLSGANGSVVIRLLWDWDKRKLLAWGDDIPLPALTKFRPEDEAAFVAFDFNTSNALRLKFDVSPDGKVLGLTVRPAIEAGGRAARKVQ